MRHACLWRCSPCYTVALVVVLLLQWEGRHSVAAWAAPRTSFWNDNGLVALQDPHGRPPPGQVLRRLADVCDKQGIRDWDVYGDYQDDKAEPADSFLRQFEAEVAADLGKEDAVFMPSGVMAQSIALLIHQAGRQRGDTNGNGKPRRFICHASSHLLLHEQEAHAHLLGMEAIVVSSAPTVDHQTNNNNNNNGAASSLHVPAMTFTDVITSLEGWSDSLIEQSCAALLVELPHRELGGKITSYDDLVQLQAWCKARNVAFHCDGARLFEATAAYDKSAAELASLFDTVYLSVYKGLGGLAGAFLVGTTDTCDQARTWLRRFGGNLYTMMPYAVSAYDGYQQYYKADGGVNFAAQRDKLQSLVETLQASLSIGQLVTFDPPVPQVNMVHGYLKCTAEEGLHWSHLIQEETGVQVLKRLRPVAEDSAAYREGYRSQMEWTLGPANAQILEDVFYEGWKALAETYLANRGDEEVRAAMTAAIEQEA
jgi:threonine aldolase